MPAITSRVLSPLKYKATKRILPPDQEDLITATIRALEIWLYAGMGQEAGVGFLNNKFRRILIEFKDWDHVRRVMTPLARKFFVSPLLINNICECRRRGLESKYLEREVEVIMAYVFTHVPILFCEATEYEQKDTLGSINMIVGGQIFIKWLKPST